MDRALTIQLPGANTLVLADALDGLPRTTVCADFHCVTTWSRLGVKWSGVPFSQFFQLRIAPLLPAETTIVGVVLRAQDGYRTTLLLEDLMAADVLLADTLNDAPLSIEHGAPLRLVAPAHYGYKSLKHLTKLEFHQNVPVVKHGALAFLDHPRARVALEERGRYFPGWLLRRLYRPLIPAAIKKFKLAMANYRQGMERR